MPDLSPVTRMLLARLIGSLLAPWPGAATRARSLYHAMFYSRSSRTIACEGLEATFATPTPTLAEQVTTFTGEQEVLSHFLRELREGDVVWDIGAGYGLYSIFAAQRLGERGQVIAFEPGEQIGGLLARNLRLNNTQLVRYLAVALGAADGQTILYEPDSPNAGTGSLVQRSDYPVRPGTGKVELRSGDSLVRSHEVPSPTVVKIDTEGAESMVLEGMLEILRSGRLRTVYCEVHPHLLPRCGGSAASLEAHLSDHGFTMTARHKRGTEYHLVCRRTA